MKLQSSYVRKWHAWLGLVLAFPALLIGSTAILMTHNEEWGLRDIPVNAGWLPGYQATAAAPLQSEIRTALTTRDGRYLIGTRYGLFQLENNRLQVIKEIPPLEVRSLCEDESGLYLAGRSGVWRNDGHQWHKIFKGDAWSVEIRPNNTVRIATSRRGLLERGLNEKHWQPLSSINTLPLNLPSVSMEDLNLARLAHDIHTGKAFLGKSNMWLWSDLAGFILCCLTLTGLFMWRRKKKATLVLEGHHFRRLAS